MNENAVNCLSARDKMRSYLKHPGSFVLMLLVMLAALVTFAVLIFLIIYILVNGLPYMKPSLFSLHYTSENASVIPALVNTVVMTLLSCLLQFRLESSQPFFWWNMQEEETNLLT